MVQETALVAVDRISIVPCGQVLILPATRIPSTVQLTTEHQDTSQDILFMFVIFYIVILFSKYGQGLGFTFYFVDLCSFTM